MRQHSALMFRFWITSGRLFQTTRSATANDLRPYRWSR